MLLTIRRGRGCPVGSLNKLPYGTAGKSKTVKNDDDQNKKTTRKNKKTNLLLRLLATKDGADSNSKGKKLALF